MDVEHETAHYHRRSVALTDGQGIPDHVDVPSEQYDGIVHMIPTGWPRDNTQTQISLC